MKFTVEYIDRQGRTRRKRVKASNMAEITDRWPDWAFRHLGSGDLALVAVSGGWS